MTVVMEWLCSIPAFKNEHDMNAMLEKIKKKKRQLPRPTNVILGADLVIIETPGADARADERVVLLTVPTNFCPKKTD